MRRLQRANGRISILARTDALTGLLNRRAFVEELAKEIASIPARNGPCAVLFLDLDDFKDINDTQGHPAGDKVLCEVAARLRSAVRADDLVARFGGDEFAILQRNVGDPNAACSLARDVLEVLACPYEAGGVSLHVRASIGIALHSEHADVPAIMMQADQALYRAKNDGRACFRFHTVELDQQIQLRVTLAQDISDAIARGELHLHEIADIVSGTVAGMQRDKAA